MHLFLLLKCIPKAPRRNEPLGRAAGRPAGGGHLPCGPARTWTLGFPLALEDVSAIHVWPVEHSVLSLLLLWHPSRPGWVPGGCILLAGMLGKAFPWKKVLSHHLLPYPQSQASLCSPSLSLFSHGKKCLVQKASAPSPLIFSFSREKRLKRDKKLRICEGERNMNSKFCCGGHLPPAFFLCDQRTGRVEGC